jgi:hypothetical protein
VRFNTTAGAAAGSRSITFRVSDGEAQSNPQSRALLVDNAPTDIALSNANVVENQPVGTTVGNLSCTDPDPDTHSYSLVSGAGSADNGSFSISGSTLKTAAGIDFETKSNYSVRIRTDDGHGGSFEKQFAVTVTDANDAPSNIALSNASVNENQPAGTAVGNFTSTDQDVPAQTFTYTFVAGAGDDDNASFQISGNQLQTNATFNKELKGTYKVRVRTTDNGTPNASFDKQFTISIGDVNDPPTDLALSPSSIAENQPTGSVVGTLSSTDEDQPGDSFTYTKVAGAGDDNNADFTISGNQVRTVPQFDFEAKSSYTIRVQTDDGHGGTFAKAVPITITNANEQPSNITLSNGSVDENAGVGATIGTLSTTDPDAGDTFTYSLVSGAGSADNASFTIAGDQLKAASDFNFEAKSSYAIRVRSTDRGGAFREETGTITINDVNDAPSDIALSNNSVDENAPQGTNVGNLSSTDEDVPANSFTYSLVPGAGDTDNNDFQINGAALEVKNPLNFEAGTTRSVRIETNDGHGGTFQKQFTIQVNNLNDNPTDIALSTNSVAENTAQGTNVGNLSTTDQDTADSFTYSLVAGVGSTDNNDFQINGAALEVKNPLNFEAGASRSVRIQTDDGHGGTFSKAFTITVTDVNDAPTNIALSNSTTVEQQPSGTTIGDFSTTDQDAGQTFTYTLQTGAGDTDNARFQISGNHLQNVDNTLTPATYSILVRSTDSGSPAEHFDKQFTITVTPPDAAPVVDLDSTNASDDSSASFTENGPAVSIAPNTTVSDSDDTDLDSAEVRITNLQDGNAETLAANVGATGITANYSAGTLTLSGTKPVASYEQVLKTVTYDNSSDTPGTTDRQITVKVNDGILDSTARTAAVSVAASNDAPVNTVPGSQTTDEDSSKTLSTGNGNAISIADVDAGSSNVELTHSVSHGTLTLGSTAGLTVTGDGTATVDLTGSISDINTAIGSGLTYAPTADYNGPDTLSVTSDDQGNTGAGGAQTDTDNVSFTVNAVNDAPSLTQPDGALTYTEDTPTENHADAIAPNLTAADVDTNIAGATVQITGNYQNGQDVLSFTNTPNITGSFDTSTGKLTLSGSDTPGNYQAALRSVKYANTSDAPNTATRTVSFQADDGQGANHASNTVTRDIGVVATNDAPTANDQTYDGTGGTTFAVGNTTLGVGTSPAQPSKVADCSTPANCTVKTGASDVDGPGPLVIVATTGQATSNGGTVDMNADGSFTYHPPVGFTGNDTFTYTVSDQNTPTAGTVTNTVTIKVQSKVWYVKNTASGSGTSTSPFATLAQAETSSGTGDTIFVFDGNNTTTGLTNGIDLKANQHLIGEADDLKVGSDTLYTGVPANRPTITDNNADVVSLAAGNEIRGIEIDPQGTGGGIFGGSGDLGGTIDDVRIIDASTAGTQPGLELNGIQPSGGTASTYNISNLTVQTTGGATGVQLINAGTVNFLSSGKISVSSTGGAALAASTVSGGTTNMGSGSVFDDLTSATSTAGGVSLVNITGTTQLGDGVSTDLDLTTSSGASAALTILNAGTVTVPAAGTSNVRATGGPAVDIQGTTGSTFGLDDVDSTDSSTDGINLDGNGNSVFNATSGDISGADGISFDLNGGTGDVTYSGNLNNGDGPTAVDITGRSGGTVSLSGQIRDTNDGGTAGGTINVSGNTAGATTFSNATKQANTGTAPGVAVAFPDASTATVNFINGGLDIDTTSGNAFAATGVGPTADGSITVEGSLNTIETTTGRGVNISDAGIGDSDVSLMSVSSNGASNGIRLNNTANANGSFTVGGNSGTCTTTANCTGGAIQNSTGVGVLLNSAPGGASLTRMIVTGGGDDGIGGSTDNGLALDHVNVTSNGNANGESGLDFSQLTGTVNLTSSNVSNNFDNNVAITNASGTLNATVSGAGSAYSGASGGQGDGIFVQGTDTGAQNLTIQGTAADPIVFANNRDSQIQHTSDAANTTDSNVTIDHATLSEPANGGSALGGGITINHGGNSNVDATITNTNIQNSVIGAIAIDTTGSVADQQHAFIDATIQNNTIGTAGVAGSGSTQGNGIFVSSNGAGHVRTLITNNTVRQWTNRNGLELDVDDGPAQLDATVHGNTFTEPNSAFAGTTTRGMTFQLGASQPGDNIQACLEVGGAGANANQVFGTGESPQPDIRYLNEGPASTVKLVGYSGPTSPSITDISNYLAPRNNTGGTPTVTGTPNAAGSSTTNAASCQLPSG